VLWLIALLCRLLAAAPFLHHPIALDDMFQYDMLGRSLASGLGYRWYAQADWDALRPYLAQFVDFNVVRPPPEGLQTVFRAPGYPFFLAGVYALVPDAQHILAARLIQVLLVSTLAPLTACLALELGLGPHSAWRSGLVLALYPILLFYPLGLASEVLFIPLLLAGLLSALRAARQPGRGWALAAGLCLGAAVLTRSVATPGMLLLMAMVARIPGRKRQAGWMLAAALTVCVPWAIRNTLVSGQPMFVEASFGYNLFVANHPDGNGGFVSQVAVQPLHLLDDMARDAFCREAAWGYIRADPGQAMLRSALRVLYFLGVEDRELAYFFSNGFFGPIGQPWLTGFYLILILPWVAVGVLSPVGLGARAGHPATRLLIGLVLGYGAPHIVVLAEPRFHLALVPMLTPFAVWAWGQRGQILRGLQARTPASAGLWAGAGLAALVLTAILAGIGVRWDTLLALLGPGGHQLSLSY
jgi:4-amino-4-deoxy-L-arabinose transferase-like glycosyltransferase